MPDDAVELTASGGPNGREESRQVVGRETGPAAALGSDVAAHHRHLGVDPANVYVVGDVHGCLAELRALWERIDPGPDERVVFVGDLVRKGPDSEGVVEFVADRDEAVSVRGNNEAKVLRGQVDPDWRPAVAETLASFPLVVSWGESMAVHGGVHPEWALARHEPDDLLEMRAVPRGNGYDGPFWFETYEGPPRVFFGHTVLASPFVSEGAVGLDAGCVYGGELAAYDCGRDRLVTVEAERTYQDRAEEKIVDV